MSDDEKFVEWLKHPNEFDLGGINFKHVNTADLGPSSCSRG